MVASIDYEYQVLLHTYHDLFYFSNMTLYIGVTNDLHNKVVEQKTSKFDSFTLCYHLTELVYYEQVVSARTAMDREKWHKGWKKDWKLDLIKQNNPCFSDLS